MEKSLRKRAFFREKCQGFERAKPQQKSNWQKYTKQTVARAWQEYTTISILTRMNQPSGSKAYFARQAPWFPHCASGGSNFAVRPTNTAAKAATGSSVRNKQRYIWYPQYCNHHSGIQRRNETHTAIHFSVKLRRLSVAGCQNATRGAPIFPKNTIFGTMIEGYTPSVAS